MRQLVNWFRRKQMDRDLDRELQYHLDRRITDLKNSGLPAQEARKRAMQELSGIVQTQEEVRDIWLRWWLTDFLYDFRFSLRSFLRTPSFTITAVLSLTLGIGATTAIYSLVDQIVLHALPVRESARLVLFDWDGDWVGNGFGSWNLMPYPVCRDLDQQKQFFEDVFCRALTPVNLSIGGDTSPVTAEIVSGNYFPVLGVGAAEASAGRGMIERVEPATVPAHRPAPRDPRDLRRCRPVPGPAAHGDRQGRHARRSAARRSGLRVWRPSRTRVPRTTRGGLRP